MQQSLLKGSIPYSYSRPNISILSMAAMQTLIPASSAIAAITFSPETETANVEWTSGHMYAYTMTQEIFDALADAPSTGRLFNVLLSAKEIELV